MKASELIAIIEDQMKHYGDMEIEFEHMSVEREQRFSQFNVVHNNNHFRFLTEDAVPNIMYDPYDPKQP